MGCGASTGNKVVPVEGSSAPAEKPKSDALVEEQRRQLEEERLRLEKMREQLEADRASMAKDREEQHHQATQAPEPTVVASDSASAASAPETTADKPDAAAETEAAWRIEFEARRTAEEQRHCKFDKNEDGSVSVKSRWVGIFTGGYESVRNPQFSLELPTGGAVSLTLERTEAAHEGSGLALFVYRNVDGARALEFRSGNVIAKTKFVAGDRVTSELRLPPTEGRPYVLVPMQERRGDAGRFQLTVNSESKDHVLRLVPSNKVISFKGRWEGTKTGGFKSPANPQFQIRVHRPVNVSITVVRPATESTLQGDGTCIFVCKAVPGKPDKMKRQLDDSDILFKTDFLITPELSCVCKLEQDISTPFIVVVSRGTMGKPGEGPFTLMIESDDYQMEAVELTEQPPRYKEDPCVEILQKYTAPGKIGLLTASPLEEIIARLEASGSMFVDPTFPPNDASLNDQPILPNALSGIDEWRRLDHLCDNPQLFLDGIEPDDMVQGELGDCWFCQAVAAIAQQNPGMLEQLFCQKEYCKYGVYCIKLFIDSQWYYIIVDDYIPCAKNLPAFAHSKTPDETWVGLLEKALAKCHGSYQAMIGTGGRNLGAAAALTALTGGDSKVIEIKAGDMDEKLWANITEYNRKHWFMGCGSRGAAGLGIIATHGYSVLDAVEAEGLKLLQLRNTWGRTEWLGDWGDDSKLWTTEMKAKLHFQNADDGIFWMNFFDFTQQFAYMYLCRITEEVLKFSTVLKGEWQGRLAGGVKQHRNPQFSCKFDTPDGPKPVNVLIKLRRDRKYDNEGMMILVYRNAGSDPRKYGLRDKDREAELVASSPFKDTRELALEAELPPSENPFTIIVCLEHEDKHDTFRLTVSSDAPQHIVQIAPPKVHSTVGMWKGSSSAGFRSFRNPKMLLYLSKRARCYFHVSRPAKGEPDGFALFVCKGSLRMDDTEDGWVPDQFVIARSQFLKAHVVTLDCSLEAGYYAVFPCRKLEGEAGESVFTLTLECDDDGCKMEKYHEDL